MFKKELTVFRKVLVSERLPEFGQRVIGLVLEQNDLGLSKFLWNVSYHDDTKTFYIDNEGEVNIEYWLEEIELPCEEDITKAYMDYKGVINNPSLFGANYILNKIK